MDSDNKQLVSYIHRWC